MTSLRIWFGIAWNGETKFMQLALTWFGQGFDDDNDGISLSLSLSLCLSLSLSLKEFVPQCTSDSLLKNLHHSAPLSLLIVNWACPIQNRTHAYHVKKASKVSEWKK